MSGRPLRAGWRRATFWAITLVLLGLWGSGTLLWALPLQDAVEPELGLTRSAVVLPKVWPSRSASGRTTDCSAFTVKRKPSGTSAARSRYSASVGAA